MRVVCKIEQSFENVALSAAFLKFVVWVLLYWDICFDYFRLQNVVRLISPLNLISAFLVISMQST